MLNKEEERNWTEVNLLYKIMRRGYAEASRGFDTQEEEMMKKYQGIETKELRRIAHKLLSDFEKIPGEKYEE